MDYTVYPFITAKCFISEVFMSSRAVLLMSLTGYSPAWDVCSLLGQCEGYTDLQARQELLAFSLTHCPPNNIHGLLAASSDLKTQVVDLLKCLP